MRRSTSSICTRHLPPLLFSQPRLSSLPRRVITTTTTRIIMSSFASSTATAPTTVDTSSSGTSPCSSSSSSHKAAHHNHTTTSAKVTHSYKHGSISEKLSAHNSLNGRLPTAQELSAMSQTLFNCRVVIGNAANVREKLCRFQDAGVDNVLVVSDFDFTISKFTMVTGSRGASCHRIIEDCGLLAEDYHHHAQAIQKKYYPLEVDPTLDHETRTQYMIDWVNQAHSLLSRSGLTKQVIHKAVTLAFEQNRFALRKHVVNFFELLTEVKIPCLIFSAGIADVLEDVLSRVIDQSKHDITIISNRGIFQEETGQLMDFETPVIHVFNKMSSSFLHTPFFQRDDWKVRKHVILLGDSQGDVTMTEGMDKDDDDILRIGFLSDRLERLELYRELYDIVILNDPGFEIPLGIVESIRKQTISELVIEDKGENIQEEEQQEEDKEALTSAESTSEEPSAATTINPAL